MHKLLSVFGTMALATIHQPVAAQKSIASKQQFAQLGNFDLENGVQILDCKIGYRTYGKLNANRSNAVLYPTGGGGTSAMHESGFGIAMDVDTTQFFLIIVDALGNGVSSSPSNSLRQAKTLFPQFTIRDMVKSQYRMLTQHLNIQHLAAIVGGSMGGFQALQWAVSYPGFMDKVVAINTTPKISTADLLWMNLYIKTVTSDTAYLGGNYTSSPLLPLAKHLIQMVITTPAYVNKTIPTDSLQNWIALIENDSSGIDANDFLWQIRACSKHDISSGTIGSLSNAAQLIKAKLLIIANKQDRMINQEAAINFAGMTKATLITMDHPLGHLTFFEELPVNATRKFLAQ